MARTTRRFFSQKDLIGSLVGPNFDNSMYTFIGPQHPSNPEKNGEISGISQKKSEKILYDPFFYYFGNRKDRLRPAVVQFCANVIKSTDPYVEKIKLYVEALHQTSLILDDVQYDSKSRGGKPTGHEIFGLNTTIKSCGKLMSSDIISSFVKSLKELGPLDQFKEFKIREVHEETLRNFHIGKSLDLAWQNQKPENFKPQESDYFSLIDMKTGSIMTAGVLMLKALSNRPAECDLLFPPVYNFAKACHIYDEIANFDSSDNNAMNDIAEDIVAGKTSYPVLFMLVHGAKEQASELLKILRTEKKDEKMLKRAIELLRENDFVEEGKEVAIEYLENGFTSFHLNFGVNTAIQWAEFCREVMPFSKEVFSPSEYSIGVPDERIAEDSPAKRRFNENLAIETEKRWNRQF